MKNLILKNKLVEFCQKLFSRSRRLRTAKPVPWSERGRRFRQPNMKSCGVAERFEIHRVEGETLDEIDLFGLNPS